MGLSPGVGGRSSGWGKIIAVENTFGDLRR